MPELRLGVNDKLRFESNGSELTHIVDISSFLYPWPYLHQLLIQPLRNLVRPSIVGLHAAHSVDGTFCLKIMDV